jgi:hypothetical protein
MRGLLSLLLLLSGCAAQLADADAPARPVGVEAAPLPDAVRAAVQAEAQRLYGGECGEVSVPARALVPVEVTGGGLPEYAVLFGRVGCAVDGGPTTRWQGTGGAMVQVWLASGGPPRMLLEHQMHGFSAERDRLVTLQHGAFCPGGAGPGVCEVIYRWNDKDRALEVASRRLIDDAHPGPEPHLQFGYEAISR